MYYFFASCYDWDKLLFYIPIGYDIKTNVLYCHDNVYYVLLIYLKMLPYKFGFSTVWSSIKENLGECGHPYPHDPPWLYPSCIIDLFYASLPPCFFQQVDITYSNIIWHKGKCRWCGQPYPKKWKAYYCFIFSFRVVTISF